MGENETGMAAPAVQTTGGLFDEAAKTSGSTGEAPADAVAATRRARAARPVLEGPADCLGMRGLPTSREAVNGLVTELCRRLEAAGGEIVPSATLVDGLRLQDARALRLLIAYARIRCNRFQVIGQPGSGYLWGGDDAAAYTAASKRAYWMGRCYIFLYSLYHREGAAVALAQLPLLAIGDPSVTGADAPATDDLAALVAVRGVSLGQVLDTLVGRLSTTAAGREALQTVAVKHSAVMLTAATRQRVLDQIDAIRRDIAGAAIAG
jgi:hypothetical protein